MASDNGTKTSPEEGMVKYAVSPEELTKEAQGSKEVKASEPKKKPAKK